MEQALSASLFDLAISLKTVEELEAGTGEPRGK